MSGHLIITIDGPAGAGKSTVAKALAKLLDISYLDTGAMYRALTLKALREKVDLENEDALAALAKRTKIEFADDGKGGLKLLLDGKDAGQDIRSLEVTNNTFYAARAPKVREILVEWQKAFGQKHSLVGEGRDLGTVVFPDATYKLYLDADVNERCERRIRELKEQGKVFDEEQLRKDLIERDKKDFSRAVGPLKKTNDMIVVDSTGLTVDQTAQKILKIVKK
jgi:cytidylate kinase